MKSFFLELREVSSYTHPSSSQHQCSSLHHHLPSFLPTITQLVNGSWINSLPTGPPEVRVQGELRRTGSQRTAVEKERWEGSGIRGNSEEVERGGGGGDKTEQHGQLQMMVGPGGNYLR